MTSSFLMDLSFCVWKLEDYDTMAQASKGFRVRLVLLPLRGCHKIIREEETEDETKGDLRAPRLGWWKARS